MKTRKTNRLFTLFLALVMLMTLAVPAFAAGDELPEKELRMVHLQWNDKGCYADEGALDKNNGDDSVSGYGYDPARSDAVLFFIWNNKTQKKESYVVPKGDGNLVVEKMDKEAIASGAKQSSYYVSVRMNEFKDGQVTANGLSFQFTAMLGDFGFFSSQDFSPETILSNEVNEETLTDLTVYFGNSYAGTEHAGEHDKVVSVGKNGNGHENLYTLEQVSDGCWKLVCKDVFAVQGDIGIDLKLEVLQPDGETREDGRGIRVYHETAPQLWFVWIDNEWDEKTESDVFFYDPERRQATSSLELMPGDSTYGILGYGGDWDENGFNFKGFTPVSVKDVKLPEGVTANTDVPAKKGAKWSQYYVELSSEAKDQNFTLTYKEYELAVSCRLPDIGVYTAPEASWETWAGPWGFPFNPVLDNEYYIISTASDAVHGRHVTGLALSAEWDKGNEEVANDGVELSKVSDGVYKLTLKDGALNRGVFHLDLDVTWTDIMENTWTDTNRYLGNFDRSVAIVASDTALSDGTKEDPEVLAYSAVADKVSTEIALTVGEEKDVYLYLSNFFANGDEEPSWKVWAYPWHGVFHSSDPALTITADEKDFAKSTLSASKAGTYEIWIGGNQWDYQNMKLFHADGKQYTDAEWKKFDETIMCRIYEDGTIKVKPIDADDSEYVDFEEMFPGETYEVKSLGFNEWEWFRRLTVTVEDAAVELPFTDVKEEDPFYNDVAYVFAHNLMNGVGEDKFNPSGSVTRAMVPTVLYRVEGEPAVSAGTFTDVAAGEWYTNAINWAAENDIVKGMGNNIFGIKSDISHEQLATMLYRYAEYKGCDMSVSGDLSAFTDGDKVHDWALKEVQWAVGVGIIDAESTTLDPQGIATRAELASYLARFYRDVL